MKLQIFFATAVALSFSTNCLATGNNFDKFLECARNEAVKYSGLEESAESIAKVAVFSCSNFAYAYLQEDKTFDIISATAKAEAVKKLSDSVEPAAMKTVMDVRLKKTNNSR